MKKNLLGCLAALALPLTACADQTEGESVQAVSRLPQTTNSYSLFESLQVRPLALSPNGKYLFAANTPDNRLEIFRVEGAGRIVPVGSVPVGLEPVAVAARSDNEVWVVNHLSDSVSVVKLIGGIGVVTNTLQVGDEPRDIVFARDRAYITTAHRGQNTGDAYDLQTPGKGRADVWVFDANNPGPRLAKLTFFADTPRALAVSADESRVYAAAFMSGNQTTAVSEEAVRLVYGEHLENFPGPKVIQLQTPAGPILVPQPPIGLIVKWDGAAWRDPYGTNFSAFVKIKLPDNDVFTIDATANPPAAIASGTFSHVGTTLFNMAVNPQNGHVYVSNTDAHNDIRFEGHNAGFTSVRGRIADSRITVIDPATGTVAGHDLNPHIDYTHDGNPAEKALSVASPQDMVVSSDGKKLYVVAQGSQKLAVYDTAKLEAGDTSPSAENQIQLSGGGPTGVVVDEKHRRAFVLTRFDNSISMIDLTKGAEIQKHEMFNPEPESVVVGRKYLYDANLTSQHGVTSCSSCHIGGDKDELAWDLGNPGGIPLKITDLGNVMTIDPNVIKALLPRFAPIFIANQPLKGPMTTQSLRGMDNHGAMHWRGDRNGAIQQSGAPFIDPATNAPVVSAQPNAGIFDEVKAFKSFNVAFPGLVGAEAELSDADMGEFTDFVLQMMYPPNPIRNLDNSLTAEQQLGRNFYFNHAPTGQELPSDRFHNCNGCHTLNPTANAGATAHPGFFGTDGRLSFEFETQIFKVPHLRNQYTKIGMFGSSPDSLQPGTLILQAAPNFVQDQIRGFGFQHDGSLGQLEHFFTAQVFLRATVPVTLADGTVVPPNPFGVQFIDPNQPFKAPGVPNFVGDAAGNDVGGFGLRHAIVAFMMAFDSNFAPIVGQQLTVTPSNLSSSTARLDLFEARANAGECDLVAKTNVFGATAGMLFKAGSWQAASSYLPPITDAQLRQKLGAPLSPPVTFTCVPPGDGQRVALDRDNDGYADWDELLLGRDPADASSHP